MNTSEWNIPDWRDRAAYQELTSLDDKLWRWQFLRRSTDYRQDWRKHAQGTYELNLKYQNGRSEKVLPWDHKDFRAHLNYLAVQHERTALGVQEFLDACDHLSRYGLTHCGMPNPAVQKPFPLYFDELNGAMIEGIGDDIGLGPVPKGQVWYSFDLGKPLAPQIKRAEKNLIDTQKFRARRKIDVRLHRELLPDYLRVLDARADKVPFAKIGKDVFCVKDYDAAASRAKKVHRIASDLAFKFPA